MISWRLPRAAVQEIGESSPSHQVHLESDSPEIPIVADAERLRRVFDNLLTTQSNTAPMAARSGSRWSENVARWWCRSLIPVLALPARIEAGSSSASSVAGTLVQSRAVASD